MDTENQHSLDRIAFIGRTYAEYMSIFDLDKDLLAKGPVLDCAAGPSSFTSEACARGFDVTAFDSNYNLSPLDLFKKGGCDMSYVFARLDASSHLYTWDFYRDKQELVSYRKKSLGGFIKDYTKNKRHGRYIHGELPSLPFPDNTFPLVLLSHLLFLYGDMLNFTFHMSCLKELIRVCSGEIRIFPLVGFDAKPAIYLPDVLETLASGGYSADIVNVPFEFLKGADRMMKIYVP